LTLKLDVESLVVHGKSHGSEGSTPLDSVEANGTFEQPEVMKLWCTNKKESWIARRSGIVGGWLAVGCGVRESKFRNAFLVVSRSFSETFCRFVRRRSTLLLYSPGAPN
jgi:hypothetical protein